MDDFDRAVEDKIGKIVPNTWAEGLNPTYKPMDQSQTELFIAATFTEITGKSVSEVTTKAIEGQGLIRILDLRIEAFKLPITFTLPGKMAALALVSVAGAMVILLIDCLNAFEGKAVGAGELANLYPDGFYDLETLERYANEYMRPRRVKWSDVYMSR